MITLLHSRDRLFTQAKFSCSFHIISRCQRVPANTASSIQDFIMRYSRLAAICSLLSFAITGTHAKTCKIPAQGDKSGDDSPAIVKAFTKCKRNSDIIFQNTTYYIKTALSFKDLDNVNIDIRGRLEVSSSS
jgi:hypothetical protein